MMTTASVAMKMRRIERFVVAYSAKVTLRLWHPALRCVTCEFVCVGGEHIVAEARENHTRPTDIVARECSHFAHGDGDRRFEWIPVNAAADCGKSDRSQAMIEREGKRVAIAARKQLRLMRTAASPDRTDRVDEMACGQPIATRDSRFTRRTPAQRSAFSQQLRACGTVYRTVDATAAPQRRIGGVHDGVDLERGDIDGERDDLGFFFHCNEKLHPLLSFCKCRVCRRVPIPGLRRIDS